MAQIEPPSQPRAPRRRKRPEDRRQELIEAAVVCLARLGPKAATGREVCRQLGVSHGLLLHYFASHEDLFLEAYRSLCVRFLDHQEQIVGGRDALALRPAFEAYFSEDWGGVQMFDAWVGFWFMIRTDPRFFEVHEEYRVRQHETFVQVFSRERPGRRLALSPDEAALTLEAVMNGLWLEACLSAGGAVTPAAAVELCVKTVERLYA